MMKTNCVFCKIASDQVAAQIVYRDSEVIAFKDNHPIAPVHLLVIPLKHIASLNDVDPEDSRLLGHMILVAQKLAVQTGVAADGYRLVINTGLDGGQSVFHLHLHLLGGKRIQFPLREL